MGCHPGKVSGIMAEIKPFGAMRFTEKAGEIGQLVCPPYDIISEEERRAYLARNPHNIIRLELPREGEDPYREAGETLRRWLGEGILARDQSPGYYLYEEEFSVQGVRKRVKGLVCLVRAEEWEKGVVLPHEETLSKAKADRFDLMKATAGNFSSIYSLYMDEKGEITPVIEEQSAGEPELEFTTGDGIVHRVWAVRDRLVVDGLTEAFRDKKLYIADGHHRYETAVHYRRWREERDGRDGAAAWVMMTLMDIRHPGLVVFPTHRLVRGLEESGAKSLLERCKDSFDIYPYHGFDLDKLFQAIQADGKKAAALYAGGKFVILVLRDRSVIDKKLAYMSPAYRNLDVTILHTLILEELLGIDKENMKDQKNLAYTRDAAEAMAAVDAGEADCAFLIGATRVEEIAAVAAAGEKMPQKSTYFYPKLITGHLMNLLEDLE